MKKEEKLAELEKRIEAISNELLELVPEGSPMFPVILYTDSTNHHLISAMSDIRVLIKHYQDPTPKSAITTKPVPKPKPVIEIKGFTEIDASRVARKIGWEMEACYELLRAATNQEGRVVLVSNDGMFDDGVETFEVGIVIDSIGDYKNHTGLTREEADKIFESYLN